MRKLALSLLLITTMVVGHGEAFAGVSDAAALFLRIAAGARAAGMGEAFVAIADDATATHWNPAGLGRYPLTSEFHVIKVTDDEAMREKAQKILSGNVSDDYSETIGQFAFRKGNIVRVTESGEERFIEYEIDPDMSVIQYIAVNTRTDDRDLLKAGVRAIAEENTGVTFEQINLQRKRLLKFLNGAQTTEINRLFETIVANWQNLKIVPESILFLEEKLGFVLADEQLAPDEYSQVIETLTSVSKKSRPRTVKIPYKVLLALWKDYSLPWQSKIIDIALMDNDIPEDNYEQYDVWVLTANELMRWDGVSFWESSLETYPQKGDYLENLVAAYTGESDEDKLSLLDEKVAAFNYGVDLKHVENVTSSIRASITGETALSETFDSDLENLPDFFKQMTLDPNRFSIFLEDFEKAYADDSLMRDELDKLEFALHGSIIGHLPKVVYLPYTLPFPSKPTCIAAIEKLLWIGTDDGLYVFNGRGWQKYTTEDELPSNKINALSVFDKNRLWVAMDGGVAYYYKGKWTPYTSENGLEDIEFTQIYGYSRDKAWVASENKLFFFNGNEWRSDFKYVAVVNDTLTRIVREFTGIYDEGYLKQVADEIKAKDSLLTDFPEPGAEIMIPFEVAFRHPITSMTYDNNHNRLWVGTTHGLKIFGDGRFRVFGYKTYTAPEDMSTAEAAADFLKEEIGGNPKRRNALRIDLQSIVQEFPGFLPSLFLDEVARAFGQEDSGFVGPIRSFELLRPLQRRMGFIDFAATQLRLADPAKH